MLTCFQQGENTQNACTFWERMALCWGFCMLISYFVFTIASCVEHAAEMNAYGYLNTLKHRLSSEQLQYHVPLELNAGGRSNFQRLCYGFRKRRESTLLQNVFCSYDDTVLGTIEAEAEGVAAPSTSFYAKSDGAEERQRGTKVEKEIAQLAFRLVALKAGESTAAAYLLGADAGSCEHTVCF